MAEVSSTSRRVAEAFLAGDVEAVSRLLAPDAVFHSPVTDYHGRDTVTAILTAVAQVLTDATATRVLEDPGSTAAFFTATIQGRSADGALLVVAAPDAPATEVTLMLRPLDVLRSGVEEMRRLLGPV